MRLINCLVENVRVHSNLSIDFSPKITLIGGANETGKSSLIDALHRTLFLKATASGAPIEALRSKLYLGHPTVQIKFEVKNENYILRKNFSGANGQVILSNEFNGKQLTGAKAEEYLASLLGVKESLGSKQAKTILPSRWAHLWVMQGSSGDDLLKEDKSFYDFDSLLRQLDKKGGAAIQQSTQDQRVVREIEKEIESNFTSRNVKKNSALWQRQDEFEKANQNMEITDSKLREYELASTDLVEITNKIGQINNIALPKLFERKKTILFKAESLKELERDISLTEKDLKPLKLRYEVLQKSLFTINNLQEEVMNKEKELETLQNKKNEQKPQELRLINELETKKEIYFSLKSNLQKEDQRKNLLQLLLEQSRIKEIIFNLKGDLKKSENIFYKREELQQQLKALPKINRKELQLLQTLNQKLRDTLTRQDAMAVGIKVLRSNQVIRLNGEELRQGQQKQLSKIFQIDVGEGVSFEIKPGGIDALNNLQIQYQNQKKELASELSRLGLESIPIAEKYLDQRVTYENQLAVLEEITQENIQTKQKKLEKLELNAVEIKKQLIIYESCFNDLLKETPLPHSALVLDDLYQQIKQTFSGTNKAFDNADSELKSAQSNLEKLKNNQFEDESNTKVIESQLNDLKQNLSFAKKEHEDQVLLKTQIDTLKNQIQELDEHLEAKKNQVKSFEENDSSNELLIIESEIQSFEKEKEKLISEKGAAKKTCENISSSNPYEAVEKANVQLETARVDYETLKRLTDAHKLLQELFSNAQLDLSIRYTKPLAKSINNFLKSFNNDSPIAELSLDQASGFSGLKLRRGNELYDFDQLSGGMKEQLMAALRLSMADVLKSQHDGCLPLVFDDAFTNSDPIRIEVVKKMLKSAVDKGLQVILLTCDPEAYEKFADKYISLDQ